MARLSKIIIDLTGARWKECPICHHYFELPDDGTDRSRCKECDRTYQKNRATKLARMTRRLCAMEIISRLPRKCLYATCDSAAIEVLEHGTCNDLLRLRKTRTLNAGRE